MWSNRPNYPRLCRKHLHCGMMLIYDECLFMFFWEEWREIGEEVGVQRKIWKGLREREKKRWKTTFQNHTLQLTERWDRAALYNVLWASRVLSRTPFPKHLPFTLQGLQFENVQQLAENIYFSNLVHDAASISSTRVASN